MPRGIALPNNLVSIKWLCSIKVDCLSRFLHRNTVCDKFDGRIRYSWLEISRFIKSLCINKSLFYFIGKIISEVLIHFCKISWCFTSKFHLLTYLLTYLWVDWNMSFRCKKEVNGIWKWLLHERKTMPPASSIRWFPSSTVCCLTFLHIQPFLQIQQMAIKKATTITKI